MNKLITGFIIILLLSLIVSACGVQEKVTSVKEKADMVKEKVDAAKESMDTVKEDMDSVKETMVLFKETLDEEGLLDGLEIPPDLLEQFDLNGIVQSVNTYGEKEVEGDIRVFAKYKVKELIYESEQAEDGMTIEYKSSGQFEDLVQYFDTVLKETEDYAYEDYYGPTTAMIYGTFDQGYVQVMIDYSSEDELTYVMVVYDEDYYSPDGGVGTETLSLEDLYEKQERVIKGLKSDGIISVQKEVDDLEFNQLMMTFNNGYDQKNLIATLEGTSVDSESTTDQISYVYTYKEGNEHVATSLNGDFMGVAIYNKSKDKTCTYGTFAPGYKEIVEGNTIPIRLLDESLWYEFVYGDESATTYIELNDGTRYVWVDGGYNFFIYSFDERLMLWYEEHWSDSEGSYDIYWALTDVTYDVNIEDDLFDW